MLPKDIALDYPGSCRFRDVRDTRWEDGIAIVNVAILGQKADKTLYLVSYEYVVRKRRICGKHKNRL